MSKELNRLRQMRDTAERQLRKAQNDEKALAPHAQDGGQRRL